ncbi:outer membrane lipoprotein carrier protein LolA [Streptomyces sp. MUM 203J]|uniref:LolA family protein n=1 Tax=Streptomyces sp. MUM 203J TaxID=2791990 RepID=UPI001F04AF3C|nr:sigma-E factor regulatory protein RseB domain-containing protein [Streptomyces sp. MUM 203J]MCH0541830.1 outer membrane lipoprotein carrier protein LolA [Streptomyces sp. MUM 203J]
MEANDIAGTATASPVRRKAARYAVPVAVAGVAAATIGLVPALAAAGDPDLPGITAQELIEKIAASDTERLSGTVQVSTDLGLPSIAGLGDLMGDAGAAKDADAKLMELASGTHTLRVAADGPDRARLTVQDGEQEYTVVRNGGETWTYDSGSNEVLHAKDEDYEAPEGGADAPPVTPGELAEQALELADDTSTSVTVDGTARIAGRDAYQLVIKPKQSGSTIGSVKVAVDAENGVPLKFTLTPSSGGKAAVDAGFTKVDFAKPAAENFTFTPPKGAKVTEADEEFTDEDVKDLEKKFDAGNLEDIRSGEDFPGPNVIGEGWTAVLELPGGGPAAGESDGGIPPEAEQFLGALGDKVSGGFGSGTVFKTRLVNALMTDDGRVYVGAVTEKALMDAADRAAK